MALSKIMTNVEQDSSLCQMSWFRMPQMTVPLMELADDLLGELSDTYASLSSLALSSTGGSCVPRGGNLVPFCKKMDAGTGGTGSSEQGLAQRKRVSLKGDVMQHFVMHYLGADILAFRCVSRGCHSFSTLPTLKPIESCLRFAPAQCAIRFGLRCLLTCALTPYMPVVIGGSAAFNTFVMLGCEAYVRFLSPVARWAMERHMARCNGNHIGLDDQSLGLEEQGVAEWNRTVSMHDLYLWFGAAGVGVLAVVNAIPLTIVSSFAQHATRFDRVFDCAFDYLAAVDEFVQRRCCRPEYALPLDTALPAPFGLVPETDRGRDEDMDMSFLHSCD